MIQVLAPSVVRSTLGPLIEQWVADGGPAVDVQYGGTGLLLRRLDGGAPADVLVLPLEEMRELARRKAVRPDSIEAIGEVGIGVATSASAPALDIATPAALRHALLAAPRVAAIDPANSTSGRHFAGVLAHLGIAEAMAPRLLLISHGYVADHVANGAADLGVQQITEILPVRGARLAGPLPPELQKTTTYAVAVHAGSRHTQAAEGFVRMLRSDPARDAFVRNGFSCVSRHTAMVQVDQQQTQSRVVLARHQGGLDGVLHEDRRLNGPPP